ncbi:hypothetical protein [Crossiella sp. CA198]|uniref:hypothetical protein n=1 Tax=Crossiella sp. CA198 TaxID=3455607 RepID=UPI003F8D0C84
MIPRPPEYGSAEWHALSTEDPLKIAAVARAAESWRRFWLPDAVTLRTEQFEAEIADRLKQAAVAISTGADWVKLANTPSHAELQRRRALPTQLHQEFVTRHGGPYLGGPVDWSTGRPHNTREAAA